MRRPALSALRSRSSSLELVRTSVAFAIGVPFVFGPANETGPCPPRTAVPRPRAISENRSRKPQTARHVSIGGRNQAYGSTLLEESQEWEWHV